MLGNDSKIFLVASLTNRLLNHSRKFSLLFVFNFTLGIMGLFGLESFKSMMQSSLEGKAKDLLGADIVLSSRFPITEEMKQKVLTLVPEVKNQSFGLSFFTMATANGHSRLMQLVKIGQGLPFYGGVKLDNNLIFPTKNIAPLGNDKIWVYPEVLAQLDLKIGDQVKIGNAFFIIEHSILDDSMKAIRFSGFNPRIYMTDSAIERTGLMQMGSTAEYSWNFVFKESFNNQELEQLEKKLEQSLGGQINVQSPNDGSERVARMMKLLADFLSLVSLITLYLSLVGIFYLYSGFLNKYRSDLKILVELGLSKISIGFIYFFHFLLMLLIAGCLAMFVVFLVSPIGQKIIANYFGLISASDLRFIDFAKAFVVIVILAPAIFLPLIIPELFSIPKGIKAKLLFSSSYIPLLLVVGLISMVISPNHKIGGGFFIGLNLSVFLCYGLGLWFLKLLDRPGLSGSDKSIVFALAMKAITRRPSSTLAVSLALGFSTFLFTIIPQISSSLMENLQLANSTKPRYFVFDILQEQALQLEKFVENENSKLKNISPMVRARIVALNEQDFRNLETDPYDEKNENESDDPGQSPIAGRSVNISYRDQLNNSEEVVEGKPFQLDFNPSPYAQVSVEQRYAQRSEIKLGDKIVFDVQGMEVPAVVTNIRSVKWTDFVPNFFLILQRGVLEEAPQTLLATIHSDQDHADLVAKLAGQFPNLSVVDVKQVITQIEELANTSDRVLSIMGKFYLVIGLMMIFIIIHHQMGLRKTDLLRMKMIGGKLHQIRNSLITEFLLIGIVATMFGLLASMIGSYLLAYFLFEKQWQLQMGLMSGLLLVLPTLILAMVAPMAWNALQGKNAQQEVQLFGEEV